MSLFREEYYLDHITISSGVFAAASIPTEVFIANDNYELVGAQLVFTTKSTSGTLQIEKLHGTQTPGNGTNLLTGTMSTAGTADTVVSGSPIGGATVSAGDRLALVTGGTQTGLVNALVQITLRRL